MTRALFSALAAALLVLSGCTSAPPAPLALPTAPAVDLTSARNTPCGAVAARVVDAIQAYVDTFADVGAPSLETATGLRASTLAEDAARLRADAERNDCTGTTFADLIRDELSRLAGGTPVQDAVAATFRADPLGTLAPGDTGPTDIDVTSAVELVDAVATAGTGSTLRLAAGRYEVASPLVITRAITLVGAGTEATTITSTAGGAVLVLASDGDVAVGGLTLVHDGAQPASVLVVAGGGYDLRDLRITGGRTADGAGGFGVVLRPNPNPFDPTATHIQRLAGVTLVDNAGGGLVVAGRQTPTVTDLTVDVTAGCALCFVEDASGHVSRANVTQAGVGLRVDHRATPRVTALTVTAADVGIALLGEGVVRVTDSTLIGGAIGVQATASGSFMLSDTTITDTTELGLRLSGTSNTTLVGVTVSGETPVGLGIVGTATAQLTGTTVSTTGEAGLLWGEQASGTASGLRVTGPRLGIQLSDAARLDLTDATLASREAAILTSGTANGTATQLDCDGKPVLLREKASLSVTQSPTCPVARGQ